MEKSLLACVYVRNSEVVFRVIAGETILVPSTGKTAAVGRLFTLNETGAFVWSKIDGERNVEAIARLLAEEYDTAGKTARRDVTALLKKREVLNAVERI